MIDGGRVAAPLTPRAYWTILMWLAIVAGGGLSIANVTQPPTHRFLQPPLNTVAYMCLAVTAVASLMMRLHHIVLDQVAAKGVAIVAAADAVRDGQLAVTERTEAAFGAIYRCLADIQEQLTLREAPTQPLRAVGTVHVGRGPGFEEGYEQGFYRGLGAKPQTDAKVLNIDRS